MFVRGLLSKQVEDLDVHFPLPPMDAVPLFRYPLHSYIRGIG